MDYNVQFPSLGLSFTLHRVALSIGSFNIYWYGILIALGLVLALAFAFHYAVDFGINTDRLVDVVLVGTVMSIVCARIYYVAFAPFKYTSIWQMIDLRQGGIAIYGAVIGAFVFGALAAKWRKVPILPLFDLMAFGFLIGQSIGRWGNFVNQEAFGCNTKLPWGMYSEGTHDYLASMQSTLATEGITVDPTQPVHPTFLYESIWCLVGLLVLWIVFFKKRRFHGEIFLLYVIWYGVGRFWIEGLRTDSLMINSSLRTSQMVALVSVAAAVVVLVNRLQHFRGRTLMVPLAVNDIKKQAEAGELFTVDTLAAGTRHSEFVRATNAMNERLQTLDLSDFKTGHSDAEKPDTGTVSAETTPKNGEVSHESAEATQELGEMLPAKEPEREGSESGTVDVKTEKRDTKQE
jgi:phosphatidylglycerol:prolipoprotein diacylglycerol transferase